MHLCEVFHKPRSLIGTLTNKIKKHKYDTKKTKTKNVLLGLLIGVLTGAVAMLLYTPQSGKRTRTRIREESIQLRDRATTGVDKTVSQIRDETNRITAEIREKFGELKQFGLDKSAELMGDVTAELDTGKTTVEAV